jgi:scyllo-inositol 2-dehydrogenase (NADP+)
MSKRIIKTGICSFGMSGKLFHAPFIDAHPGFALTAITERHLDHSRAKYSRSILVRSVEELCSIPDLELVVVNTPTHLHYEHTKTALRAGKHVVVEKPFTVTVDEAIELSNLASKENLVLSVYQNRRYDGDYKAVKNVIDRNLLGELREVEIRYDRYRPIAAGKSHKEGNLPGAGTLFDLSPHLVDQAVRLFGFPKALFADVWKMRDDVEADDYFELLLYYDKLRVRLKATCIARQSDHAYILHGMKGSFLQQRSDLQEQYLLEGLRPSVKPWCPVPAGFDGILHTESNGEITRTETRSEPGNYMQYYDELYHALTGVAPNPVPPADAILNMKIIEAAHESVNNKKLVIFNDH